MLGIVYYGVIIIKILIMIGLKWAGVNKGWRAPASRSLDSTGKREEGGLELAKYLGGWNTPRRTNWPNICKSGPNISVDVNGKEITIKAKHWQGGGNT